MGLGLLDRINHGYAELEPIIVGLMAMNRSFMLIGRHGTGKTRLARLLSRGYGAQGFAFYDATKDDLISIAGVPDPAAIRDGRLRFVPHQRSIWDKSTIVVDEITRAGKESQNLWLEILEERTCFGLPLSYRTLIATANPESYAAAFQLDEALLDRFYAVLPVPELQAGVDASDVATMIRLASRPQAPVEPEEVARVFVQVQRAHEELVADGARERVSRYLGGLVPELLRVLREQNGPYLSPRTYCRNLPETILAVAAYHQVAGSAEPLLRGAVDALRYGVATKLQVKPVVLEQLHQTTAGLLGDGALAEGERLKLELSGVDTFEQRLSFLEEKWEALRAALAPDEIEKVLGALLRGASQKGEKEKLVALKHTLDRLRYEGDALRQVDGRLIITLNNAINFVTPLLARLLAREARGARATRARAAIGAFQRMVAEGTFLGRRSPAVRALQTFLIDMYEGDEPAEEGRLLEVFSQLELGEG